MSATREEIVPYIFQLESPAGRSRRPRAEQESVAVSQILKTVGTPMIEGPQVNLFTMAAGKARRAYGGVQSMGPRRTGHPDGPARCRVGWSTIPCN